MRTKLFISIILLTIGITMNAQTSKESANASILSEFADKLDNYDIYVFPTTLGVNDTIFLADGTYLINPFESSWCYFINENPLAGWAHPCKYYITDNNSDTKLIVDKDIYPTNYSEYEYVSSINRNISPSWTGIPDTIYNKSNKISPNKNQWALLFCSYDPNDNDRFWGDLSCVYTALTNRFGFIENQQNTDETWQYFNHILVVAPNGVSNIGLDLNNSGGYSNQDFFSSINQGFIDNMEMYYNNTDCSYYDKNTIKLILDNFAGKDTTLYSQGYRALNSTDNLFVYITGHGKSNGENSYLLMANKTETDKWLYDYELSEWLKDIECSQMTFVLQPCYSGGFIDDLMDMTDVKCNNRVVYSSSSADGVSYGENYINSILSPNFEERNSQGTARCNEFTFYWSAALLGYYPIIRLGQDPPIGPWDVFENNKIGNFPWTIFFEETETLNHDEYDVSPDTNNDGVISLDEAFIFARKLDTWDRLGYYNPILPYDIHGSVESPQSGYESSFSKDFITLDGYKGVSRSSELSTSRNTTYSLSDQLTLGTGTTLTINDNTTILGNGHSILNYGAIQTNIDNSTSKFYNLGINSYGNIFTINNCYFFDGNKILVTNGVVDIKNSTFDNTPLEIGQISPALTNKVTSSTICGSNFLNSENAISISSCSNVNIADNEIKAKSVGIYLNNCLSSIFHTESNKDNAAVYITDNSIQNCTKGILSYHSSTYIYNNKIFNNCNGISLYNLSNTVVLGKSNANFPNQTQEIKNNTNIQIETIGNSFPKNIRYNCIMNNINNNYLIHSIDNGSESLELDISYNSWKPLDDNSIANKLYANNGYFYNFLPTWNPSVQLDTFQIDINPPARMLETSDSLIGLGQYNDAYNILIDIIDYYPNTNEAIVAMKSMLYLRYYTDNNYNELKNYYRTNTVILTNINLTKLGDNLANKCDEILHNYNDAIRWYESVIEDENTSYEDKVFATIDLGNLYLIMREESEKFVGSLTKLVPKSAEQHSKTTAYLLSTLSGYNTFDNNQYELPSKINQNCLVTTDSNNNIKVYIKEGTTDIVFYNALGVVVKQLKLNEGENIISSDDMKTGIYIWKAVSSNNTISLGKLFK